MAGTDVSGPLICVAANALTYPQAGGHLWVYLNWALSLRGLGCRIAWLEPTDELAPRETAAALARLRSALEPFALDDAVVLARGDELPDQAAEADALIDLAYLPARLAHRFHRSVLVDLDPGPTQLWASRGELDIGGHDVYATVGEGVADGSAAAPDLGLRWLHVPPCVALDYWPVADPPAGGAYTTVTHWWESDTSAEIDGEWLENSKRAAFEPLLDLPRRSRAPLELALGGLDDADERAALERRGWSVKHAEQVVATPAAFAAYVRGSRGEFSAAKPAYVALGTRWLSDRTACYLASGRPAIVEDTGGRLGRGELGLLRFTGASEAARALEQVEADYAAHCAGARALAERELAGSRVVGRLLELLL